MLSQLEVLVTISVQTLTLLSRLFIGSIHDVPIRIPQYPPHKRRNPHLRSSHISLIPKIVSTCEKLH